MPSIPGNELGELALGDLLSSVAQGIAEGQRALDLTSVQTLIALANTPVHLIPEITEVITPTGISVPISGGAIQVTGARVTATAADPVTMNALQAGIVPTFYQFSEATISLKVSLQVREVQETGTDGSAQSSFRAFSSNVNFRSQNTYSYAVDAASTVTAVIRPVPAPLRTVPATITVNTMGKTPTVTINP
jgi:hypothetical protein